MLTKLLPQAILAFAIVCALATPARSIAAEPENPSAKDKPADAATPASDQIAQNTTNTPEKKDDTASSPKSEKGFFGRLIDGYSKGLHEDTFTPPEPTPPGAPATPAAPATPPEKPRKLPTPFDAPPFPVGEYQLGGSPCIGCSNQGNAYGQVWPLMYAIQGTEDIPEQNRINMYGWVDVGGNVSTSTGTHSQDIPQTKPQGNTSGNYPLAYAIRPNNVELDQAVLYIERLPDEAQQSHFDWGFRASALYGLDYRFMIMKGINDDQLLERNETYGWDFPMMYADLYFPDVAEGMNIRVGRYISIPDIEAQLAPDNPMYTHSLLYSFDAYTQMGAIATIKLSNQWKVQMGLSAGNDVAPWVKDAQPTLTACVQWIAADNMDSFYPCLNSLNDGKWGYNNMQSIYWTYTHKFNEKFWTTTEYWYMWETGVKSCNDDNSPGCLSDPTVEVGPNGRLADEWAILNYLFYRTGPNSFITLRNEYFNDKVGQRTGFATDYTEHAIGMNIFLSKLVNIRPEIRYEKSYAQPVYNFGTSKDQATASMDVIFRF
jgi:Putative beta-barrel porin-2, OmpL-like. bbp2